MVSGINYWLTTNISISVNQICHEIAATTLASTFCNDALKSIVIVAHAATGILTALNAHLILCALAVKNHQFSLNWSRYNVAQTAMVYLGLNENDHVAELVQFSYVFQTIDNQTGTDLVFVNVVLQINTCAASIVTLALAAEFHQTIVLVWFGTDIRRVVSMLSSITCQSAQSL